MPFPLNRGLSPLVCLYHIFCPIVEHLQLKSLSFPDVLNIYKGGRHYICSYCERERKASEMYFTLFTHSSLVDYLAQVKNWKNEPNHSDCVLSYVWVLMSTTQNMFMNLPENLFFISKLNLYQFPLFKGGTLMKNRFFGRFINTP